MPITRTAMIDDDGSGETGTVLNNAWKQELYNQIDAIIAATVAGSTSPPGINVYATGGAISALPIPPGTGNLLTYLNAPSYLNIQGMQPGLPGQLWTLMNVSVQADLSHFDPAASGTAKLWNIATSAKTPLNGGGGNALYQMHAGIGWRLVFHEQGPWITPTYNGAAFTGNAAAWNVPAGSITTLKWVLRGRSLTVAFTLGPTTVAGTTVELRIVNSMFGNFTAASTISAALGRAFQTVINPAEVTTNATNGTYLACVKLDGTAWVANATTYIYGEITFDVV